MKYVSILGFPTLSFAHVFSAKSYRSSLPAMPKSIEIGYISKGCMHFENEDGEKGVNCEGTITCNFFKSPIRVETDTFHEHHTIKFTMDYILSDTPKDGFFPLPSAIAYSEGSGAIRRIIDEIIDASNRGADSLTLASMFLKLLSKMSSATLDGTRSEHYNAYLYASKAKTYIMSNLKKQLSLSEIASELHISPEYLCSVFKHATGETVISFINRTKLRRVKALMDVETLKLCQAAEMLGFNDPNYASRLYKKLFGKNITEK